MLKTPVMSIDGTPKCEWRECFAGMGLVGNGQCFAFGGWWMQCCPEFQDEDEWIKKMKNEK